MISKPRIHNPKPASVEQDATVPLLGTWRRLYTAVIVELAVLILLFYLFTKAFE